MATMITSSSDGDFTTKEADRKRKSPSISHWRTETSCKRYSSKLLDALRRVSDNPPTSRAVRDAADRALASLARGRTRWSRAILSRRRSFAAGRRKPLGSGHPRRIRSSAATGPKRKEWVLGRLVPGCRKLSLPAILDETSDYIAALEMQVRAMSALAGILVASGAGTLVASAPEPAFPQFLEPQGVTAEVSNPVIPSVIRVVLHL